MLKYWLFLAAAIVAEVCGTTAMKASDGFTRPLPALIVVAAYGVAFFCFAIALRVIPVGVAYAIWSGVGILLVTLVGWLAFGQKLDAAALVGLALIVAGVLVLSLLSRAAPH